MRNIAFKGEKNAKFKCEITRIKAKKRESQMRNNANKGEKRKSQMRNNAKVKGEKTRNSNAK